MLEIHIQQGDLTKTQGADAIVFPANSFGWMGGSSASAIKENGGPEIERQAKAKAPLEIGEAIATPAGKLPYKAIIHAPMIISPAEKADGYSVRMSIYGALHLADDLGYKVIAMPGMGTGIGAFPKADAAQIMIEEIKKFKPLNLEKVILVDLDEELVEEWKKQLNKRDK